MPFIRSQLSLRAALALTVLGVVCFSVPVFAQVSQAPEPIMEDEPMMEHPEIQPLINDAPPVANAPQTVESDEIVPLPEVRELAAPQAQLPRPSAVPGEAAPAIPDAAANQEFDENLFFDAEQLVPESEIAKKGAPSKVNPALSPGSSLVISTKDAGAGSQQAQLVAAQRAAMLGRFESALEIYNNLYAKNKRDPNILFGRATTLQSLNRDEEAIAAYEELLDLRPRNLEAQINMNGLIGKRYPAVALRALNDLYAQNPNSTPLLSQIAIMEAQLGHYEDAIRYLGMAASMDPQNAGHLFNMAVIADRAGDTKGAIKYYEEALETDTLYGSNRSIPRESVYERLAELR